ncbi:Hypothetical_protein [Hexamita inflata]|uniref:Hypothetical_protein n=1 Tax=Hexamita inflata TaxID=28002 RepID=A0AA86NMX4_9EUKA|nr:Hypothetical protein HINF_LOCUS9997 [Hexamita inflata]
MAYQTNYERSSRISNSMSYSQLLNTRESTATDLQATAQMLKIQHKTKQLIGYQKVIKSLNDRYQKVIENIEVLNSNQEAIIFYLEQQELYQQQQKSKASKFKEKKK